MLFISPQQKEFRTGEGIGQGVVVVERDAEAGAAGGEVGGLEAFSAVDTNRAFPAAGQC